MRWLKRFACVLPLYLGACGHAVPDLPVPQLNEVVPAVRQKIQSAADDARKRPNDSEVVGHYGVVLEAHDQYSLAVPVLSRAARLDPARFDWRYYLAIAYRKLGKSQEALAAMDKAIQIEPNYVPLRLLHAEALLAQGNADASKAEYQRVLAESASNAAAHLGLGRAFAAMGDYGSAVREYETACSLFPPYAVAHYAAAQAYRRLGDAQNADRHQKLYLTSNQLAPPSDDWRLDRMLQLNAGAEQYLQRSLTLAAAGRIPEAVQANLEALRIDSSLVLAHINLISLYAQQGRPDEAEQHFRSAVGLAPNRSDAYYNYGVLLVRLNREKEALEAFRRAVELDPRHASAQVNYGFLLEEHGDIADAMKHYAAAISIEPKHRLARYHLGRLLIGRGRPAEAVKQFQQILEPVGPDSADIYYGLATAYLRAGDAAQALACTRQAYALAKANHENDIVDRIGHDLQVLEARLGR